ncbi:hypothetical protein [Mycobacteroides abscessus]|uniref:hypothetical protein n=1 Tax=Mycobacteroides abscessus TaxID=36809 RepID=UPI000C257513|nr:hypothetical protein [Mycobacteroides abscessus]
MAKPAVRNSLSRVDNSTYICNRCGLAEVMLRKAKDGEPRQCLYFDEAMGVGLVTENEPGYYPFAAASPAVDATWVQSYVKAANEKSGLGEQDANDIVVSSMFGRRQKFIDKHYASRGAR